MTASSVEKEGYAKYVRIPAANTAELLEAQGGLQAWFLAFTQLLATAFVISNTAAVALQQHLSRYN